MSQSRGEDQKSQTCAVDDAYARLVATLDNSDTGDVNSLDVLAAAEEYAEARGQAVIRSAAEGEVMAMLKFEGQLDDLDGNTFLRTQHGGWEVRAFNEQREWVGVVFSYAFYSRLKELGLKPGVVQRVRVVLEVVNGEVLP
jgi:hypothetical protein